MGRPLALVNGDVWTMATPADRAHALLVEHGRIRHVGDERSILRRAHAQGVRVVDVGGRRVLPGFIDSHTHLVHQGLLHELVDLRASTSKEAALAKVRRAVAAHRRRGPLLAEGWDESQWRRHAWPTRDELDALTRRFPLVLRRIDGHVAVANTPALDALEGRLLGVDHDRGLLVEEASLNLNQVWPTPVPTAVRAADVAQRRALELGLTTVHDFVVPHYFRAYQELHRRGRLRLRVQASLYVDALASLAHAGVMHGLGDEQLRVGGVKLFADGSLGAHTAALRTPYHDEPKNRGRLNWSDETLRSLVQDAHRAGLQTSIHAIGDAAIDQVLGAYARLPHRARDAPRARIEHFELHHDEHGAQARRLGVALSMQPNFVGEWSRRGGLYHRRLGPSRYRRNNEFRRLLQAGARVAFGSDCMPLDPWFGLESCMRAPHASQRLRVEDAVSCYTAGAADALGRGNELGTLAPGFRADVIVVEGDWRKVGGLAATRVRGTLVGGRWARPPLHDPSGAGGGRAPTPHGRPI